MPDLWVTCVSRVKGRNAHSAITHLGGSGWRWSRAQVVELIRYGSHDFYLVAEVGLCRLGVVDGPEGPQLRAHSEGEWTDALLALPECR